MRVAIVHDWLTGMRGGERCLETFLSMYPGADVFTLLHVPGCTSVTIDERVKQSSFISRLPGARRYYRMLLPLYPFAVKQLDVSGYDLVVSLSHAAAKNVDVPARTPHICYCFTPMRYIWDQAEAYFGSATPVLWPVLGALRSWDARHLDQTAFVGISKFVAARIRCFYGRRADVIYPAVDTSWITPQETERQGEAFLYAGALVPYKRPELVVEAFNRIGEKLWVVGSGPARKSLERMAGKNIEFFGKVSDSELASIYARSRALVFPGVEDFGMVPIECMAAGRPVIGLYEGGLKETVGGVKPWEPETLELADASGVFFERVASSSELQSLISSVYFFMEHEDRFRPRACIEQAAKFSPSQFRAGWRRLLLNLGLDGASIAPHFAEEPGERVAV